MIYTAADHEVATAVFDITACFIPLKNITANLTLYYEFSKNK